MPQRYLIVAVTAVAAMWMYIDRVCFSTLADPMKVDLLWPVAPDPTPEQQLSPAQQAAGVEAVGELGLSVTGEQLAEARQHQLKKQWADGRMSYALGAFFFTYALFQIPMGTLADRFGARRVLALSIAAWSIVTASTGFVSGFVTLFFVRLMLGVTEAGAYPAAAGLVKRWAKPTERGRFSSVVALGGRTGGALAPLLTAALAAALVGVVIVPLQHNPSGANWRGVFVIYGLCGLAVAVLFWLFIRDNPVRREPESSEASAGALTKPQSFFTHLGVMARSRNLWLFGAVQFGVNVGWAILITLLPSYLNEAFDVPLEQRGEMQTVALVVGCTGMAVGGFATDFMRTWLGPKYGRSVPIALALAGCAVMMFLIPTLPTPWAVIYALGAMAFLVDMHNPSIWSFAQDVGGKKVGAALGWGNMWGNFGAALSPVLLNEVRQALGWNAVFVVCGVAFVAAAICGLMLDATKPVSEG
jgi:MFS family permease